MQVVQVAPSAPPAAPSIPPVPQVPVVELGAQGIAAGTPGASTSEVLQGLIAQRNELKSQLKSLTSDRYAIARRLREGEVSGVDKAGLESRMQSLDARILNVSTSLAAADQAVATQMAVPGAYVPPFREQRPSRQDAGSWMPFVVVMSLVVPLSLAMARRIWRRGSAEGRRSPMSPEMDERLHRLEQAVDAIAVEVERVGEGQRFVNRLLSEGPAEPVMARVGERMEVPR